MANWFLSLFRPKRPTLPATELPNKTSGTTVPLTPLVDAVWVDDWLVKPPTTRQSIAFKQPVAYGKVEDTHSMEPALRVGDVVVTIKAKIADLRVGHIIVYRPRYANGAWDCSAPGPIISGGGWTHRIKEIGRDGDGWFARTRGDNAERDDPCLVREEDLQRQVIAVVLGGMG